MKYRSAILGCGPRAQFHIEAYEGLKEIDLTAVCDVNRRRLDDCGEKFNIDHRYEDLEQMLQKERPDILHIVTPPSVREVPIEMAIDHGVRGVLVEKPVALTPSQAHEIEDLANRSGVKIAVNMQRRYFSSCRKLREILNDGVIGDIRFVRCVTKGNILSMGPHMIDLLLFILNDTTPLSVWATARGMNGYEYGHPAPANVLMRVKFPNEIVAYFEDAEDTYGVVGETEFWQHFELDVLGSKGRAWWCQNCNWGYQSEGMSEPFKGKTCWEEDDVPGQREFTRAMASWLDDKNDVHDNCLTKTMMGFNTIMGGLQSAFEGRQVDYPFDISPDIIQKLEGRLQ